MHKTLAFPAQEPGGHAAGSASDALIEPHGDSLMEPHGGSLVDLLAAPPRAAELKAASRDWPSWDLTPRQFCDLELLLNGSFSPLSGFLGRADHDSVCQRLRLADGTLWPIPITLDVPRSLADALAPGRSVLALRDPEGVMLAACHVEELWERTSAPAPRPSTAPPTRCTPEPPTCSSAPTRCSS